MWSETKIKSVSGTDIFVGGDGKFFATINGRRVVRTQMRDLEKLIMAESTPVPALQVSRHNIFAPEVIKITAVDSKGVFRGEGGKLIHEWSKAVFLPDDDVLAELKQLCEEERALRERWEQVVDRLTPMTREYVLGIQAEARDAA